MKHPIPPTTYVSDEDIRIARLAWQRCQNDPVVSRIVGMPPVSDLPVDTIRFNEMAEAFALPEGDDKE